MCGRYAFKADIEEISDLFTGKFNYPQLEASYNIAPSQKALIVKYEDDSYNGELAKWGLVPRWMKKNKKPFINARSESFLVKPSFKYLYKGHRCVVPADGFYEWKTVGGKKHPFYFHLGKTFAFAGLWEQDAEEEDSDTFVILTTDANETVSPIHSRMPVILGKEQVQAWLKDGDTSTLESAASDLLKYHEVSLMVNSPRNDFAECIEPV